MSPLNVNLPDLITQLDTELGDVPNLDKISEAQRRSHTLADLGDQLVGHFVAKARESGASWSQIGDAIGVSKQAAQQRWVPPTFSRFTQRARHVIVLAQERTRALGHQEIDTEHILLGLLGEPDGLAAKVLVGLVGSTDAIEQALSPRLAASKDKKLRGHIPFTSAAKRICATAEQESISLGHHFVGTEHVLLATLLVGEGLAAEVLTELGAGIEQVRPKVISALAAHTGGPNNGA